MYYFLFFTLFLFSGMLLCYDQLSYSKRGPGGLGKGFKMADVTEDDCVNMFVWYIFLLSLPNITTVANINTIIVNYADLKKNCPCAPLLQTQPASLFISAILKIFKILVLGQGLKTAVNINEAIGKHIRVYSSARPPPAANRSPLSQGAPAAPQVTKKPSRFV